MSIHTFGSVTVDTSKLPAVSVEALVKRGLSHYFGNEIASKISSRKNAQIEKTKTETEAGTPLTDDEISALREQFISDHFKALEAGTIGHREPSAAVDPLEAEMRKIAKGLVVVKLAAAKLKTPTKDEKVKFANGQEFTLAELIDRQIAKESDAITKEAKKNIAAKAKKVADATSGVKSDAQSVEDMGL